MIEAIAKLAEWAAMTNSTVAWLLLLNFASLLLLLLALSKYVPLLIKALTGIEESQKSHSEAIVLALQTSTQAMQSMVQLLNVSATGQAARPILLTLDGVGPKVDEIERAARRIESAADEGMARLERIEKLLLSAAN